MPRQARLDIPGALHHIMIRGINKSVIFRNKEDKKRFLQRLGQAVQASKSSICAWVLMDNHIHLLFRSGQEGMSTVMRKVLTWYAQYYNRRHKRTGHLFENRYKSILCDEDLYLHALVRYIHLNPVRAKIIKTLKELDQYPWSGHRAIIEKSAYPWMDYDTVLARFADTKKKAITKYREYMEEGLEMGHNPHFSGGGLIRSQGGWSQVLSMRRKGQKEEYDERILGSGDFVNRILKDAEEKEIRQIKLRRSGLTLVKMIQDECKKGQVSHKELEGGSRRAKVSLVRAEVARRGVNELGLSAAEIARHLGVATSSITRAIGRMENSEK